MNTGIQNNYLVLQEHGKACLKITKLRSKKKKKDESMSTDIIALNIMKFVL